MAMPCRSTILSKASDLMFNGEWKQPTFSSSYLELRVLNFGHVDQTPILGRVGMYGWIGGGGLVEVVGGGLVEGGNGGWEWMGRRLVIARGCSVLKHRHRDDHACSLKYGDDWQRYKRHVPSLFIPKVY